RAKRRVYIAARSGASNRVPVYPQNAGQRGVAVIEADSMGRYIDDILQPGEKVLYSTNAHWIFYWPAIVAWIVALVLFLESRATVTEGLVLLCLPGSAGAAIGALYCIVEAWFHRWAAAT